jgi:hypothetical protein
MPQNKAQEPNPWLTIPWEDYEGHMSHPTVMQSQFLSDVFREILHKYKPKSMAVLGCSTGNGFEHIDSETCRRVTAVDINPTYLEILQDRFRKTIDGLECLCEDLVACELKAGSYDLIHCALIFEYLEPRILIDKINHWLCRGGVLTAVLQLPSLTSGRVTETEYSSLKNLEPIMMLVEPAYLKKQLDEAGFVEIQTSRKTLKSMKEFYIGHYKKR